jgi:hypothetical protein
MTGLRTCEGIVSDPLLLSNAIRRPGASMSSPNKTDLVIDLVLMMLITSSAFALAYHPYFFGDELIFPQLASKHNFAFWPMFREINAYKPRLVYNGIAVLLAKWQEQRWVTAALQVGCTVWINALLYGVVRYLFGGSRALAWLLIATVLTSRYGIVFYYDYFSGLLDLLATALLLSALLAAWLAWREPFEWRYAAAGLAAAVLCIFVHERYVAGLLAAGCAIATAEWVGSSAKRRIPVLAWALSLGVVPLVLFWMANTAFGSISMLTGTAGREVSYGWDTLRIALAYGYNVFLGGNYGHSWYWGGYNHLHPDGEILGWGTTAFTVAMTVVIVLRKGFAWRNRWLAAGLVGVAAAMIVVASLPGWDFLQARWMFPVGILVSMVWIIIAESAWRQVVIAVILATNLAYLLLSSHDSMAQVSASRSASSLAGSLLGVVPIGRSGIVVGLDSDSWTIGGCCLIPMGPRQGDTFTKVNLKSAVHIDPFVPGFPIDPAHYDFGLAFDGFSPDMTARYRLVSVAEALAAAGVTATANYEGLWYHAPAESEAGWGINLTHQADVIFATWFTYDVNGKAWWLSMTANKTAPGIYSGQLNRTNGAPFSAFVPPVAVTAVGTGTLTFTSGTTGTFAYSVDDGANVASQTKAIVLQTFGTVPTCVWGAQTDLTKATNYQDLWWAAGSAESGWGVNLIQQGTTIFATWFTYDTGSNPVWYSAQAAQVAPSTYSGPLVRTTGPAFNAIPFNPSQVGRTTVGTATFTFTNGNAGTFAYQVNDGRNGVSQSKAIARQIFQAPGTVCQ